MELVQCALPTVFRQLLAGALTLPLHSPTSKPLTSSRLFSLLTLTTYLLHFLKPSQPLTIPGDKSNMKPETIELSDSMPTGTTLPSTPRATTEIDENFEILNLENHHATENNEDRVTDHGRRAWFAVIAGFINFWAGFGKFHAPPPGDDHKANKLNRNSELLGHFPGQISQRTLGKGHKSLRYQLDWECAGKFKPPPHPTQYRGLKKC